MIIALVGALAIIGALITFGRVDQRSLREFYMDLSTTKSELAKSNDRYETEKRSREIAESQRDAAIRESLRMANENQKKIKNNLARIDNASAIDFGVGVFAEKITEDDDDSHREADRTGTLRPPVGAVPAID